jgi:segregation and condensation protein A
MRPGTSPGVPVMATPEELGALGSAPTSPVPAATRLQDLPAVSFGEGRRPESRTQVQMAEFDGPLALLLSLIEARQLDVLTVPLAALADAYLDALARLTADRLGNVSSFVAIASQLILIKSRAMLPRRTDPTDPMALPDEGTDPEAELRARLLLYRAYRDAGLHLADEASRRIGLFRREPGAAHAAGLAGARPTDAPALDPLRLVRALDRLAELAPPPEPPSELMSRSITISERAEIIRAALRDAPTFVLQDLLAGVRDRVVIAVTFLAMLELMKRREIVVEQAEPWGPIVARATTTQERAAAGVEVLDDAPIDETLESFA